MLKRYGSILLAVCAALALATLAGSAPAFADSAWWGLASESWPATLPSSGEGTVTVLAENMGDAQAAGAALTMTDRLPSGVTPQSVLFYITPYHGGKEDIGHCGVLGQVVTCRLSEEILKSYPLNPYEVMEMRVLVKVEGVSSGAQNEVSVSGAGALPASIKRPLKIGATQTLFGLANYGLTPENDDGSVDTQAGSHPFQLTSTLTVNQGASPAHPPALIKDLHFQIPPGLIGNPTTVPQCTDLQFTTLMGKFPLTINSCPKNSAVGVADITIDEPIFASVATVPVPLFNLTPAVGEPARFGFSVLSVPVILDTSVRTGGDYGVTVTVRNISEIASFMASRVTFWGIPGDPRHDSARGWSCVEGGQYQHLNGTEGLPPCTPLGQVKPAPFLVLPTSCTGQLQSTVEADSWAVPGVFTEPLGAFGEPALDGCNRLPFSSSISVVPDGQAGSTPTGLTVGVHVPQEEALNPTGLAPADVKDTNVTLPAGVALNPAGADGLLACSEEQVALKSGEQPSCPEASKIGTVKIETPLLPNPLEGAAYLATQNTNPFGSLIAMYVFAEDPISGSRVKLSGEVVPDPVTGQLVSTFKNTPQLPFETFELHFFGGARAPLTSPAFCGAYTTTAAFAPWSGNEAVNATSTFNIVSGPTTQAQPNGTPCPGAGLPFNPTLTGGATNINAGAFTPLTGTFGREDGEQQIARVHFTLPPGLSGILSHVQLCGEAQANAGTCGPESLIGEDTVAAGVGPDPIVVYGAKIYITGPYHGAPFGLSIVNPVKAGPFDLERDTSKPATNMPACDCLVDRAKLEIDPITAAVTITSNSEKEGYAIPHMIDGIPAQIKRINFTTTRKEFQFNPTNCAKMAITGTVESAEGSTKPVEVPFQVTNCKDLAFKPTFKVSTAGRTSRQNGASLSVKLTYPKAPFGSQANIRSVKVNLPKQLPSNLKTLQKACPHQTFEANPASCLPESRVGEARATTPLLPVPLTGPAYFVSYGGAKFPELVIVLQGYGVTLDLHGETFIDEHTNVTSSTFHTVPDAPVGTFELTLPQGKYSALAAPTPLCGQKLVMPTKFTAQNGVTIKQNTPITVTSCPKHKAKKKAKHKKKR